MRQYFLALILFAFAATTHASDPAPKAFLKYVFGDPTADAAKVCLSTNDIWMLPGRRDDAALKAIDALSDDEFKDGVAHGVIGTSFYFFEMKGGKIDPTFYLEAVYAIHRRLALEFVMATLMQDRRTLDRLTTDGSKVNFKGEKMGYAEIEQYAQVLSLFPVVRSSQPEADAASKSVTYRLPLGKQALSLTMVKAESKWKIDSTGGISVPLELFFARGKERTIQYAK